MYNEIGPVSRTGSGTYLLALLIPPDGNKDQVADGQSELQSRIFASTFLKLDENTMS